MKLLIRSVSVVSTFSNITTSFCLSTLDPNFRVHRSMAENGTVYTIGMMFDQILQMKINMTQFGQDGFLNNTYIVSKDQKNVKKDYDTIDMVLVSNSTRGWSASATLDQKIIVHQFHKSDFLPRIAFKVNLNETINALQLVALDQDSLFIATISDKTTSQVIYIKLNLGISQSIRFQKIFRNLLNYAIPILTGENAHLILASSKLGASNPNNTGFQMILFRTRTNDFTSDYNCYSIEQAVVSNIENLTLTWIPYNVLANNVTLVTSDVLLYIETNTTWLNLTSMFTVRAESSKMNDAGTDYCNVQSPKLILPSTELSISAAKNANNVDLMNHISMCQTVNLTYTALVNGANTLKSWMNFTKDFIIIPSLITSEQDIYPNQPIYNITINTTTSTDIPILNTFEIDTKIVNNNARLVGVQDNYFIGYSISLYFLIQDDEGDTFYYNVDFNINGLLYGVFSNSSGSYFNLTWTPALTDIGIHLINLTCWDSFHVNSKQSYEINFIVAVNQPPYFTTQLTNYSVSECHTLNITLPTAIDPEGYVVSYIDRGYLNSSTLDYWIKFNSTTRTYTATPPRGKAFTNYYPEIRISDPYGVYMDRIFKLSILQNLKPQFIGIDRLSVVVPDIFVFNFTDYIYDSDSPASSLSSNLTDLNLTYGQKFPSWLSYNKTANLFQINGITNDNVADYSFQLDCYDECNTTISDTMYFTLEVKENYPPTVANSLSNITMYYGQGPVNFSIPNGTVSDDRGIITYSIISPNSSVISEYFNVLELNSTSNILKLDAKLNIFGMDIVFQATDDNNQSVSISNHMQVLQCTDLRCTTCVGPLDTDCLGCIRGIQFSSQHKCEDLDLSNIDINPMLPFAISPLLFIILIFEIALCIFIGVSPIAVFLMIKMLQIILACQIMTLYYPVLFSEFIRGFQVVKWDFKFFDFIFAFKRPNICSHFENPMIVPLVNIEFTCNSFIINFMNTIAVFVLLLLGALWVRLLRWAMRRKSLISNFISKIRLNLHLSVTILFLIICSTSEIKSYFNHFGTNIDTIIDIKFELETN